MKNLPTLLRDIGGLLGAGLLTYGVWRIYQPAAFIIAGLLLLTMAVLLGVADRKE